MTAREKLIWGIILLIISAAGWLAIEACMFVGDFIFHHIAIH